MEVFSLSMSLSSQNILFCVCLCVSSLLIRTPIQYNFILYLTKSSKTPCPNKFTFTEPEVRASAELSEVYNSSHSTAVPYLGGLCIIINRIWANFEYTWYTKINYSILILFLALVVSWNHCIDQYSAEDIREPLCNHQSSLCATSFPFYCLTNSNCFTFCNFSLYFSNSVRFPGSTWVLTLPNTAKNSFPNSSLKDSKKSIHFSITVLYFLFASSSWTQCISAHPPHPETLT